MRFTTRLDIITDPNFLEDTSFVHDVKYQDIIYYKWDRNEIIHFAKVVHIDFLKAMSEMEKLDYTFDNNYIGFHNNKTNQCVQFIRLDKNEWFVDHPINTGRSDGYTWIAKSDSKTVSSMMRLFFEEITWNQMLEWKMTRFNWYEKTGTKIECYWDENLCDTRND